MANALIKTNIPASTLEPLPSINNKTNEAQYINELIFNRTRTNEGQVSWTSETSGITYDTSIDPNNVDVYNCGQTGLLNLLQQECSNFMVGANDFNSLGEHYTILNTVSGGGGRYYKIAEIEQLNTVSYYNQLSLLVGGVGEKTTDTRNYFFIDFSTDITGVALNVTHFATINDAYTTAILDKGLLYFGYVLNNDTNMAELWFYASSLMDSLGITVINNYENDVINAFTVGKLLETSAMPVGFVRAEDQHLIKNTDISNPNILINTNFKNPINQRGQETYTSTVSGNNKVLLYTIDCWKILASIENVTLTIPNSNNPYTTINIPIITDENKLDVNFYQELPILNFRQGEPYTIQCAVSNVEFIKEFNIIAKNDAVVNPIIVNTETSVESGEGIVSGSFIIPENLTLTSIQIIVVISGSSQSARTLSFNWIKLEKGYVKTKYIIPNNEEELLKCYKYYYRINGVGTGSAVASGDTSTNFICKNVTTSSSTTCAITLNVPVPMRIVPTITFSSVYFQYFTNTTTTATVSSFTIFNGTSRNIYGNVTLSGSIAAGLAGTLCIRDTSSIKGYIAFSAEY